MIRVALFFIAVALAAIGVAWFREGHDTPDLRRAKMLLDKTLLDAPAG